MRENVKTFQNRQEKIKLLKINKFLLKRLQMFYIFRTNVHKTLGLQTNVYVPNFMEIKLFQAYSKHNKRLKLEKP